MQIALRGDTPANTFEYEKFLDNDGIQNISPSAFLDFNFVQYLYSNVFYRLP